MTVPTAWAANGCLIGETYLDGKVEANGGRDEQHGHKDGVVGDREVVRRTRVHGCGVLGKTAVLAESMRKAVIRPSAGSRTEKGSSKAPIVGR